MWWDKFETHEFVAMQLQLVEQLRARRKLVRPGIDEHGCSERQRKWDYDVLIVQAVANAIAAIAARKE